MSKNVKKTNPYEKKKKRSLKISRKQWIAIICAVSVAAIIGGIVLGNKLFGSSDPHAGHNHGSSSSDGHYEGDGHNHGTASTNGHYEGDGHNHGTASTNGHYEGDGHNHGTTTNGDKVKYQMYSEKDQTYRLVFLDNDDKSVAEFDKIPKKPTLETINADTGVYELSWSTGSGPNEYVCVYYNTKTGQVSQKFIAPRGTDGVRIAYGSKDQTQVIVQDLFNAKSYYKEHDLTNPKADKNGDIIVGGTLKIDKKTVVISYNSGNSDHNVHASINLYA